jgi:hypothetical protein
VAGKRSRTRIPDDDDAGGIEENLIQPAMYEEDVGADLANLESELKGVRRGVRVRGSSSGGIAEGSRTEGFGDETPRLSKRAHLPAAPPGEGDPSLLPVPVKAGGSGRVDLSITPNKRQCLGDGEGFRGVNPFGEKNQEERKKSKKSSKDKKKSKKSAKDKKKKRKARSSSSSSDSSSDRSDGSSSSSVFRVASAGQGRSSQGRLMAWAKRHPGRLTARLLQKMEDAVSRSGENPVWKRMDCPASAKSYFLQVLGPRNASAGPRGLREMSTLSTILDHIALGRNGQAADVASQRLKSLETAIRDGHWNRSVFLELVPEDHSTLVSTDEHHLMRKESELHKQLYQKNSYKGDYSSYDKGKGYNQSPAVWIPNKGKGYNQNPGKGKKGQGNYKGNNKNSKEKGKKGQDKDKGTWE